MKYPIILALVAIAGCSGRGPRQKTDPRIADPSRPLVLLTHPTEPPSAYVNEAGEVVGENIDLARRIAEKMGRGLVIESVEFGEIIPRLKAGSADMGISTITITEARSRDVDFSIPYSTDGACFLYKTGGRKPLMSEISSFRIGVEADTIGDLYLCRHGCDPTPFIELDTALEALEKDEIDAVFFDAPALRAAAESSGGRLTVSPLETRDGYGVAVDKRRPDVLEAANAVISEGGAE